MRHFVFALVFLFLIFPFTVFAQDNGVSELAMAAQNGDREAQYLLGLMYFDGDGVTQDYKEAEKWWLAAAQRGLKEAQYSIGVFYSGHGEAPASLVNKRLAYVWLRMAALQGVDGAEAVRKPVAADMDERDIGEAERLAATYYEQYVLPYKKQVFTVELNGTPYYESANVTPKLPINAIFHHSNPAVVAVRMQHPGNPAMSMTFEMGKTYRIQNHEDHMKAGHTSASEFIALDKNGKERGKITLSFVP